MFVSWTGAARIRKMSRLLISTAWCASSPGHPLRHKIEVKNVTRLQGGAPPWRRVTFLTSILWRNGCPGELAHQAVEINSLLILRILAAPVQDTNIDTRIHTPENLAGL